MGIQILICLLQLLSFHWKYLLKTKPHPGFVFGTEAERNANGAYRPTANAEVFPTKGYYNLIAESPAIIPTHYTNQLVIDLENFSVETGKEYMVYIMSAPIAVKDTELTISILNSQKKEYQCKKTPTADYFAGEIKGLKCDSFTEVPQSMGLIIDDWGDGGNIGGDAE